MKYFFAFLLCIISAYAAPLNPEHVRAELVKWEGYALRPYKDGKDICVGVGHNLTAHHEPIKRIYTDAECRAFFYRDYSAALDSCRAGITDFDGLPPKVQMVAIGVAFGVGRIGFARFKMFRLMLSRRAYNAAAGELADSKWAQQVSHARAYAYYSVLRNQY